MEWVALVMTAIDLAKRGIAAGKDVAAVLTKAGAVATKKESASPDELAGLRAANDALNAEIDAEIPPEQP